MVPRNSKVPEYGHTSKFKATDDKMDCVRPRKTSNKTINTNLYQILVANATALTSLTCGLLFGWTSPAIPVLISKEEGYNISLEQCSYFPAIGCAVLMICCPLPGIVMDKIGRKPCLLVATFAQILACLIYAFSKNIYLLYLGKVFNGIESLFVLTIVNVYLGEILSPKLRGLWGNLMVVSCLIGQFLTNVLGAFFNIKTFSLLILISPLTFLCTYPFLPESPYFHAMKDQPIKAKKVLRKIIGKQNLQPQFEAIERAVKQQCLETSTWKDLFLVKSNRKGITTIIFLFIAAHSSGFISFAIYAKYMFSQSAGSLTASQSTMIFTGTLALSAIVGMNLSDKLGRRRALMGSLVGIIAIHLATSVYFYIEKYHTEINLSGIRFFPLLFLVLFAFIYHLGIGIVPDLMIGELFSTNVKAKALCVFSITFGISSTVNTKIFQLLIEYCGLWSPFAFFGLCAVVYLAICYFIVPETKGQTLEQIQLTLGNTIVSDETNFI